MSLVASYMPVDAEKSKSYTNILLALKGDHGGVPT